MKCASLFVIAALCSLLAACGAGTGSILALGGGSSSGGVDTPSLVSELNVSGVKDSPASVRFTLRDAEDDPTAVVFRYLADADAGVVQRSSMVRLEGGLEIPADPSGPLAPGRYRFDWHFAEQLGPGFRPAVRLGAEVEGVEQASFVLDGLDNRPLGLGNDPPRFETLEEVLPDDRRVRFVDVYREEDAPLLPGDELASKSLLQFRLHDSSGDDVDVLVEYCVVAGEDLSELADVLADPDAVDFHGGEDENGDGLYESMRLDDLRVPGVLRGNAGQNPVEPNFVVLWNTHLEDVSGFELKGRSRFVILRLSPHDLDRTGLRTRTGAGEPVYSRPIRVDNNLEPIVDLDQGLFLNPDARRGIPLPIRVRDEEGDRTRVVVQYFTDEEQLNDPELDLSGMSPAEIEALLADPVERARRNIAEEVPRRFEGVVRRAPGGAPDQLRAPELARGAGALLHSGGVAREGRRIELLRPSRTPEPWDHASILSQPVAARALGDGTRALFLDQPGASSWRLQVVDLGTGAVIEDLGLVSSSGGATALAPQLDGRWLVASHDGADWTVHRVTPHLDDPRAPEIERLMSSSDSLDLDLPDDWRGPMRDLVASTPQSAVASVAAGLLALRLPSGTLPASASTILPLDDPHGLAVDPTHRGRRVFVAETGRDRVLLVDTTTSKVREVPSLRAGGGALGSPLDLEFERANSSLLVVTRDGAGFTHLDQLAIGRNADFDGDGVGESTLWRLLDGLPGAALNVSTGPDGLRLLCCADAGQVLVGGGVEQVREIVDHDLATQVLTVDRPFEPALDLASRPAPRWRIHDDFHSVVPAPDNSPTVDLFVWDSVAAEAAGHAFFRLTPYDDELGRAVQTPIQRGILYRLDVDPQVTPSAVPGGLNLGTPDHILSVDIEGDGVKEFLTANRGLEDGTDSGVGVVRQVAPDRFETTQAVGDSWNDVRWLDVGFHRATGGRPMVAGSARFLGRIVLYEPQADLETILADEKGSFFIQLADIDHDGLTDVLATRRVPDRVDIYLQPTGGFTDDLLPNFSLTIPGDILDQPIGACVCDINSDNRRDILVVYGSELQVDLDGDEDYDDDDRRIPGVAIYLQGQDGAFRINQPDHIISWDGDDPQIREIADWASLWHLDVTDFDGDGLLDLAASYRFDRTGGRFLQDQIKIIRQTAPMKFEGMDGIGLTDESVSLPFGVLSADFDQDGDSDLVSSVVNRSRIPVFVRGPEGFLEPPVILRSAENLGARGVLAEDVNGDGWADVVVSHHISDELAIYLQDRPGSLPRTPDRLADSAVSNPFRGRVADLDSDGLQDVLIAAGRRDNIDADSDVLAIFYQLTPGVFGSIPQVLELPDNVDKALTLPANAIETADMDGDGQIDIIASYNTIIDASTEVPRVAIFYQACPGGDDDCSDFSRVVNYELDPDTQKDLRAIVAEDFDGDGRLDLALAATDSDRIVVAFQSPGPSSDSDRFDFASALSLETGNRPMDLHVFDVDVDGVLDLVSCDAGADPIDPPSEPSLSIFRQDPTQPGHFSPWQQLSFGGQSMLRSMVVGDFDGDGRPDLCVADTVQGEVLLLPQRTDGSYAVLDARRLQPTTTAMLSPVALTAADFDQDGDLDLFVACGQDFTDSEEQPASDQLLLFRQTAPGIFDLRPIERPIVSPTFVEVADIDGDNELDVLTGSTDLDAAEIYSGGR